MDVLENFSLVGFNTFGLDIKTKYFTRVTQLQELKEILKSDLFLKNKTLILGGGSNVLFTKDFDGLVVLIENKGIEFKSINEAEVLVKASAGEVWHDLVMYSLQSGLGGIENLSLIPGTVGAAPMQNIGAYGVEIKNVFHSLTAINKSTGDPRTFDLEECRFGYRQSIFKTDFKNQYIIWDVTLKLSTESPLKLEYGAITQTLEEMGVKSPSYRDVSDAVTRIRQSKLPDPKEIGNSGSFFKNPVISQDHFKNLHKKYSQIPHYPSENEVKIPAGWLIEATGWKGKKIGQVGVHDKQALVLVNFGGGTGKEILQLSDQIQKDVYERFGIELTPEVNIID